MYVKYDNFSHLCLNALQPDIPNELLMDLNEATRIEWIEKTKAVLEVREQTRKVFVLIPSLVSLLTSSVFLLIVLCTPSWFSSAIKEIEEEIKIAYQNYQDKSTNPELLKTYNETLKKRDNFIRVDASDIYCSIEGNSYL